MIVFTKDIRQDRLRMAYNNDVIRFYSDFSAIPKYCDVRLVGISGFAPNIDIRLYPDPNYQFMFNFKEYVAALINTNAFDDTITPDLSVVNSTTFMYNDSIGRYLQKTIVLKIVFEETLDTTTLVLDWIAGAEQPGDFNYFKNTGLLLLSPVKKKARNSYYLKYWQGYPFDITVFSKSERLYLDNKTNLLSASFDVPLPPPDSPSFEVEGIYGPVSRLYFSDGRTDESIEDLLPLSPGVNQLVLGQTGVSRPMFDNYITIEKMAYAEGAYFKWLNQYGGYSYWLFENTYAIDRSTKALGEIDRDSSNLEDTFARVAQIGRESQDTIKVVAELLTEEQVRIVQGLLDSPKIYLFTGQPYARNSPHDWIEVVLKTGNARLKNAKHPLTNFAFDFELPARYTQKL